MEVLFPLLIGPSEKCQLSITLRRYVLLRSSCHVVASVIVCIGCCQYLRTASIFFFSLEVSNDSAIRPIIMCVCPHHEAPLPRKRGSIFINKKWIDPKCNLFKVQNSDDEIPFKFYVSSFKIGDQLFQYYLHARYLFFPIF